ncbi:HAMP domain-containing protein [Candidatus Woesearchaeota archaeon]|nr:HAMP domain-containing protein [Candidatus Woesearchaeota archaeon]
MKFKTFNIIMVMAVAFTGFLISAIIRYFRIMDIEGFALQDFILNSVFAGAIVLGLSAVIGIYGGSMLVRGIERIRRNIRRINRGEIDVNIRYSRIREINELIESMKRTMISFKLAKLRINDKSNNKKGGKGRTSKSGMNKDSYKISHPITSNEEPSFLISMKVLAASYYGIMTIVVLTSGIIIRYFYISNISHTSISEFIELSIIQNIVSITLVVIMAMIITYLLTKEVSRLTRETDRITKGNLAIDLTPSWIDEVQSLIEEIDMMKNKIRNIMQNYQKNPKIDEGAKADDVH